MIFHPTNGTVLNRQVVLPGGEEGFERYFIHTKWGTFWLGKLKF